MVLDRQNSGALPAKCTLWTVGNTETDVSLTVAQISIALVLLTYAGFGFHNVQNVHQETVTTPTSCFYYNCFIGPATAWIWKKTTHFFRVFCVCV